MMTIRWTAAIALVFSFAAAAQADDIAYCQALAAKYQNYIVYDGGHYRNSAPIDTSIAADQCRAGNTVGIPALERKLRDAKIDLPARG